MSDVEYDKRLKIVIGKLVGKGAVVKCRAVKGQVLSSYFIIKKPDGSDRFILNLKYLNKFVEKEHFKMEDMRTAVQLVFPNYYLASVDLQDAYFLIPLHRESRKFVRFEYLNDIYEFVCVPFGLSTAPFTFTKIMKVVVRYLRNMGYTSVIYLDDYLAIEESRCACEKNINVTRELLEYLGFIINWSKSELIPAQRCNFLGMTIDTVRYCIELPNEKRIRLIQLVELFLELKNCTIRNFARLIGKLVSCCPALEYAWLYTKEFEKEKTCQLIMSGNNYNKRMALSDVILNELRWWRENLRDNVHFIKDCSFKLVIFTDASLTGWGATDGNREIFGYWSGEERKCHINYLELLTVKIALIELASNIRNVQILLRGDNTTAISYINKMGGVRSDRLRFLAREIWQWAEERRIILFASYIASEENVIADRLSRMEENDKEWELNHECFNEIRDKLGCPDIDLFASEYNKKCKDFCSWRPQKGALFIDAFTVSWTDFYFYAFPPFAVILKSLAKIKSEKAYGIIVVPAWRNQPWFPMFEKMMVGDCIVFEPNENLLLSPCRTRLHPRAQHLSLIAARVSGRHY